jgi:hypothetical protein
MVRSDPSVVRSCLRLLVCVAVLLLVLVACKDEKPETEHDKGFREGHAAGLSEGHDAGFKEGRKVGYAEGLNVVFPGAAGNPSAVKQEITGVIGAISVVLVMVVLLVSALGVTWSRPFMEEVLAKTLMSFSGWLTAFWISRRISTLDEMFSFLLVAPLEGFKSVIVFLGSALVSFAFIYFLAVLAWLARKPTSAWPEAGLVFLIGVQSYVISSVVIDTFSFMSVIDRYLASDVYFGGLLGLVFATVTVLLKLAKLRRPAAARRFPALGHERLPLIGRLQNRADHAAED